MKFQKGLLDDLKSSPTRPRVTSDSAPSQNTSIKVSPTFEDDTLFQTHRRTTRSWRQYFSLLIIIVLIVSAGGLLIFYFTLPSPGDQVRPPKGLEAAVRAHFLDVEKRNSGEIDFYYCESFYWARVEVEKRPDIKTNPVYRIGSYAVRSIQLNDSNWEIKATPITTPELDVPCS